MGRCPKCHKFKRADSSSSDDESDSSNQQIETRLTCDKNGKREDKKCCCECNGTVVFSQSPGPGTFGFQAQKIQPSTIGASSTPVTIGEWSTLPIIGGVAYYNDGNFNTVNGQYVVPATGGYMVEARLNAGYTPEFPVAPDLLLVVRTGTTDTIFARQPAARIERSFIIDEPSGFPSSHWSLNMRISLIASQIVYLAFEFFEATEFPFVIFPGTSLSPANQITNFSIYRLPE